MNYIYDIVLDFNRLYYDFYEWKDSDEFLNIKKIPAFRISEKDYVNLKYNDVIIDGDFVDSIKDKCLLFSKDSIISCLISDGREVMGILLNDKGNILGRSSLIFDEEDEILLEIESYEECEIKYKTVSECSNKIYSRCISDKFEYLKCFFNSNNNIGIYKYIYYDLYEKDEDDIDKIKSHLLCLLDGGWNGECDRLYFCIRLLSGVNQ